MKTKFTIPIAVIFILSFIFTCCGNKETQPTKQETKTDTVKKNTPKTVSIKPDSSGIIALEQLPSSAKDYVSKNFPGYTIQSAAFDPLCQGGDAIDVAVTKQGQPNLSLIFKYDGSFVQKEEDIPLNTAPKKVADVIKIKYTGYAAGNPIEKLTLADNTTQYLIDITKGSISKEVILTPDGVVVCEK